LFLIKLSLSLRRIESLSLSEALEDLERERTVSGGPPEM